MPYAATVPGGPNVLHCVHCVQCSVTLPETCLQLHTSVSFQSIMRETFTWCSYRCIRGIAKKKTRNIIRNITKLLKTQLETTFTQKESTKKRQRPTKTFLGVFSFRNDSEFLFDFLVLFCGPTNLMSILLCSSNLQVFRHTYNVHTCKVVDNKLCACLCKALKTLYFSIKT